MDIKYSTWKKRTLMLKELMSYFNKSAQLTKKHDEPNVSAFCLNLLAAELFRKINVIICQPKKTRFQLGSYSVPKETGYNVDGHEHRVIPHTLDISPGQSVNIKIDGGSLFEINESFRDEKDE